jgi:plastocyanin
MKGDDMRRHKLVFAVAVAAVTLGAWSVRAQDANPAVVAIPGSFLLNYATPVAIMTEGGKLDFINVDLANHDVVALDNGTRIDCPASLNRGTVLQPICPLFWTDLVGLSTTQVPVVGVEDLAAGKTYNFRCSIHGNMTGQLLVLPAP